jgi:hypothetical protein
MGRIPDLLACVDREALAELAAPYGAYCFLVDGLGSPGPVPVGELGSYRPDVSETIAWHPGYREVLRVLYHGLGREVTFLSPTCGRGAWASLELARMAELSAAAGYTIGNFVGQCHPRPHLSGNPLTWGATEPVIMRLKAAPEIAERLPLVALLVLLVATTKEYPTRTCLVGLPPDDAYLAACASRLARADIGFVPAPEFFARCLLAEADQM